MNLSKLLAGVVITATAVCSTVPATADQTHWWQLMKSSRGVQEVCADRDLTGPTTPARWYEFMKGERKYQDLRIEEDTEWGPDVHQVKVRWSEGEEGIFSHFFELWESVRL
jgi:hypothetical protein